MTAPDGPCFRVRRWQPRQSARSCGRTVGVSGAIALTGFRTNDPSEPRGRSFPEEATFGLRAGGTSGQIRVLESSNEKQPGVCHARVRRDLEHRHRGTRCRRSRFGVFRAIGAEHMCSWASHSGCSTLSGYDPARELHRQARETNTRHAIRSLFQAAPVEVIGCVSRAKDLVRPPRFERGP